MNEYIFRGKRYDNGEWVEGDLYHEKSICVCITWHDEDGYNEYEVIPETVGMWSGLVDKNGVKIFDGDIVLADDGDNVLMNDGDIAAVKWVNEDGMFIVDAGSIRFTFSDCWTNDFVVIANIHDNPELWEGEA